jgi:hypothetical protein
VTHAAGVTGDVYPFGEFIYASDARGKHLKLILGELRCLVQIKDIEFGTLKIAEVFIAGTVPAYNAAAICKNEFFSAIVVPVRSLGDHVQQGTNVVFVQFRIGAADYALLHAGEKKRQY